MIGTPMNIYAFDGDGNNKFYDWICGFRFLSQNDAGPRKNDALILSVQRGCSEFPAPAI